MEDCLGLVRTKATHFLMVVGKRWGLEYYADPSLSASEAEYFAASQRPLPMLCFVEDQTWKEAARFHKQGATGDFETDRRVLRFIDQRLMHGDVRWITPFSNFEEIVEKLRHSWLVCESEPCHLAFVEEDTQEYFNLIDNYACLFHRYCTGGGRLPLPRMSLPKKDVEFIERNSKACRDIGYTQTVDGLDKWRASFTSLVDRTNVALKLACDVHKMGVACLPKGNPRAVYDAELKDTIRSALERYLRFAREQFYGDHAYGKVPNFAQAETSLPCRLVEHCIHEDLNCAKKDVLLLRYMREYDTWSFPAYVSMATFERWIDLLGHRDPAWYVEFLEAWATLVVPQAIAFAYEITENLLKGLSLETKYLLGVGRGQEKERLIDAERVLNSIGRGRVTSLRPSDD